MRTIVLLAQDLTADSDVVKYTARIARACRAQVVCLSALSSFGSTAELLSAQSQSTRKELRSLRARQTTGEWVETLEELRRGQREEARRTAASLRNYFAAQGIPFCWEEVRLDLGEFFKKMGSLGRIDLLIAPRIRFPRELTSQGIMTLGDLGARFACRALDVEIMEHFLRPVSRKLLGQLLAYGSGAAAAFALLYGNYGLFSGFLMRGGVLPALAVMAATTTIAWVYGKTAQCLYKLTKLDIY